MKLIFMGTPDFAVPTLDALVKSRHEVVGVYTQTDKEQGRGKKVVFSPVKTYALAHGLKVFQPKGLKKPEVVEEMRALGADAIIVAAYGKILRPAVLEMPKYGCINVHASLLPKYRGAAPIQWAILGGEKETGVTVMQMDEGLDTGDILKVIRIPVDPKETGDSLFEKLSALGGPAVLEVLDAAEKGELHPEKQGDSPTPYAAMLEKTMGELDFSKDAAELERLIRALNSWPSAFTHRDGKILKIWAADVISAEETEEMLAAYENGRQNLNDGAEGCETVKTETVKPGTVIAVTKKDFTVLCGNGALRITEVQPEGKKRMDAGAYLRGNLIEIGEELS